MEGTRYQGKQNGMRERSERKKSEQLIRQNQIKEYVRKIKETN